MTRRREDAWWSPPPYVEATLSGRLRQSVPRGHEAADVVAAVLFVGGAWVVVDKLGILGRLVGALALRFQHRGLLAIPFVSLFFASMGALENMQEEIIRLFPCSSSSDVVSVSMLLLLSP
jgi:uncharacterized ion transporter superfamily protein YfcC